MFQYYRMTAPLGWIVACRSVAGLCLIIRCFSEQRETVYTKYAIMPSEHRKEVVTFAFALPPLEFS